MNSNTFQDSPGPEALLQVRLACRTPTRRCAQQAVEHNIECIEIGETLGSKALTVWIGDGSNFPGQTQLHHAPSSATSTRCSEIYDGAARRLAALHRAQAVRAGVLLDRRAGLGHQLPRSRSELGPKAFCLVDLGHHAPNVNIEMIVARLIQFRQARRLPLQRFQVRRRRPRRRLDRPVPAVPGLQRAGRRRASARRQGFEPAYMIDQSHNVTDPIESLMRQRDRDRSAPMRRRCSSTATALDGYQEQQRRADGDADAEGRLPHRRRADPRHGAPETGGAIDPVAAYRASGYRGKVAAERPAVASGGVRAYLVLIRRYPCDVRSRLFARMTASNRQHRAKSHEISTYSCLPMGKHGL